MGGFFEFNPTLEIDFNEYAEQNILACVVWFCKGQGLVQWA